MKHKLRLLTTVILVLGAAAAGYLLLEPTIKGWKTQRAETKAAENEARLVANLDRVHAANIPVDATGDRQLLLAIARLEQRGSVTASIRHEAHVAGLRLDGKGDYLQQGRGAARHVRWLLESQHDGVRASLLQCTDGRTLWVDRHIASGRHIHKVDLWQLRKVSKLMAGEQDDGDVVESAPFSPQLAANFGGLPMLLESLRLNFEFTAPGVFRAPESLGLGNQPVLGLIGRWRPEALAAVLADISAIDADEFTASMLNEKLTERLSGGGLPDRVPLNVLILLGQHDLFPYLIEYRAADDLLASLELPAESLFQLSREPLARMELFDVVFDREIKTMDFMYEPPEEPDYIDVTDMYVQRLKKTRRVELALAGQRRMATEPNAPRR